MIAKKEIKLIVCAGFEAADAKECENLNYLREKSVDSIPEVLFRCDLDDLKLFCQSSVKDKSGQTIDRMTEKHWLFLANLYNKTRIVIKFEETDYYALLKQVKKNAVVLKETDLEIVQRACELISKKYNNSTVEFGFYHGDFTPWNTVIENGKIKVFIIYVRITKRENRCLKPYIYMGWSFP